MTKHDSEPGRVGPVRLRMMDKEIATMGWLSDIARSLGLMIHNIRHPDQAKGVKPDTQSRVVRKETEERREGKMTLRRTTIEEIEIQPTDDDRDDNKKCDA